MGVTKKIFSAIGPSVTELQSLEISDRSKIQPMIYPSKNAAISAIFGSKLSRHTEIIVSKFRDDIWKIEEFYY